MELPKSSSNVIHFKIKFDNKKYVEWKISKGLMPNEQSPTEQIQNVSTVQQNHNNPQQKSYQKSIIFSNNADTDNLRILTQPFGASKKFDKIDLWYNQKYPDATDTKRCGWCTLSFTHKPTVIPYNFQKKNTRIQSIKVQEDSYIVKGCFCTFNCALAQIINENSFDKYKCIELLYSMFRTCNSKEITDTICPSPPKELLIDYGGILTDDEYRSLIGDKAEYLVEYPHIVCVGSRISRVKIYEHTKSGLHG
jgi:hypothetical protein